MAPMTAEEGASFQRLVNAPTQQDLDNLTVFAKYHGHPDEMPPAVRENWVNAMVESGVAGPVLAEFEERERDGFGVPTYTNRFARVCNIVDHTTDAATLITLFEQLANILFGATKRRNETIDTTMRTAWATALWPEVRLAAELKAQFVTAKLCPNLAAGTGRSDTTAGKVFLPSTLSSFLAVLSKLKINPLAILFADIYTRLIQLSGAEKGVGSNGAWLLPITCYLTKAEVEALIATVTGYQAAQEFAKDIGMPYVKFPLDWLQQPTVVSSFSDYGIWALQYIPVSYDNAKGGNTFRAFNATLSPYYCQLLGVGRYLEMSCLWRATESAGTPGFITQLTLGAGKVGIQTADDGATDFTDLLNATTAYQCLTMLCQSQSVSVSCLAAANMPYSSYITNGWASADVYNMAMIRAVASIKGKYVPITALNAVLDDYDDTLLVDPKPLTLRGAAAEFYGVKPRDLKVWRRDVVKREKRTRTAKTANNMFDSMIKQTTNWYNSVKNSDVGKSVQKAGRDLLNPKNLDNLLPLLLTFLL